MVRCHCEFQMESAGIKENLELRSGGPLREKLSKGPLCICISNQRVVLQKSTAGQKRAV